MNAMFLMGGGHDGQGRDDYPLYLTELGGKTVLEAQIDALSKISPRKLIFCVREEDARAFHTDLLIKQVEPGAKIVPVHGQTNGSVCTALLGAEHIDNDGELLLLAIDDFIDGDRAAMVASFRDVDADVGVVSFMSVHPRYSFVRVDESGSPVEFAEKRPISRDALASFYWFRRGADFVECAKSVIRKDTPVNGNFYISQTLNEMILLQRRIAIRHVENGDYHPLKTEAQLAEYVSESRARKESR